MMASDTIRPIFNHSEYTKTWGNPQKTASKILQKAWEAEPIVLFHCETHLANLQCMPGQLTASWLVLTEIVVGSHGRCSGMNQYHPAGYSSPQIHQASVTSSNTQQSNQIALYICKKIWLWVVTWIWIICYLATSTGSSTLVARRYNLR